jgi:hypothetical protein
MIIKNLHLRFGRIFRQRCFYLFVSIVLLIGVAPFFADTLRGRLLVQVIQVLLLIAAVAAVGRTTLPFVIALLLGIPAFGFQVVGLLGLDDPTHFRMLSTAFYLAFYVVAVGYLLRYVFSPEVMTDDKLFGAAAAYLMLGILFAAAYSLIQHLEPGAFGVRAGDPPRTFYDLMYMSFGCLTSNGPGDVTPIGARVRALVVLEEAFGTLFVAILIARLAGIYPPKKEGKPGDGT